MCTGLAAALTLAACGGGGGEPGNVTNPPINSNAGPDPVLSTLGDAFDTYWNRCAKPRTGIDPYTGKPYPDRQGSLRDELTFLRAWSNQYYLWYNEIPTDFQMSQFSNPVDYFDKLMSPIHDKDMYHFTYPSDEWDKMSNSGIELGYGITWSSAGGSAPRTWRVAIVEPGSPAAAAGLRRGDQLTVVDGADFVNGSDGATVDKINAGLFPSASGLHSFTLKRNGVDLNVSMQAADVTASSVKYTRVIDTPTGKVGYLSFENHNAVAERQLIESITTLRNAGINDLVLDLRYNGGGLLGVAGELSYMIAGPTTENKVFSRLQYNNKIEARQTPEIIRFVSKPYGYGTGANAVDKNAPLPYLGLSKVTVLTTSGTCSASESIINGLRGVDVEVNVIGATTCGKPYGFTPVPNCGTTYFSVEFQSVNAKGFGDYANGIAPNCSVADDLSHDLGDTNEAMLSAALSYRANRACPARTSAQAMALATPHQVRSAVSQIAIYNKPR
ncbi:PDZ domain-containing protein [Massilia sp. Dwa41.01b]|uniref:S41 family peptidase n=1 Tax=unclassified Massilia TaxID=2609279 RepID=UPI0016001B72|nr:MULTISPECIES: S41 family peptidase [unclassified Massilia]QNA90746.1 PDZ domain-containing protein [Massilia sp. Dwa41.01b]QNA97982.1 PDZ domain-containing protein [Massilia sp. Se16.2.3]